MATKEELSSIRRVNVEQLIEEKFEGRQARFAAAIGKPANYVWRLLTSGPHAKGIGEEVARQIEDRLGLETYALDKNGAEPPARGRQREQKLAPAQTPANHPRSISVVPLTAVDSLHGKPSSGWVRRHAAAEVFVSEPYSEGAFALTVPDASMTPMFLQGEMLVFDPEVAPEAGDYVLARVGAHLLFRRYRPSPGGGFMLDALNDAYAPAWSERDHIVIIGSLVEHHRTRSARKLTAN
jgi:phage repressor protein C with HTH and peptisase S24 domain